MPNTIRTWSNYRNFSFEILYRRCSYTIQLHIKNAQEIQSVRIGHMNSCKGILWYTLRVQPNCRWSRLKRRVLRHKWTSGHRNVRIMIYRNWAHRAQRSGTSLGRRSTLKGTILSLKWQSRALLRQSRPRIPPKQICISLSKTKFEAREWFRSKGLSRPLSNWSNGSRHRRWKSRLSWKITPRWRVEQLAQLFQLWVTRCLSKSEARWQHLVLELDRSVSQDLGTNMVTQWKLTLLNKLAPESKSSTSRKLADCFRANVTISK